MDTDTIKDLFSYVLSTVIGLKSTYQNGLHCVQVETLNTNDTVSPKNFVYIEMFGIEWTDPKLDLKRKVGTFSTLFTSINVNM